MQNNPIENLIYLLSKLPGLGPRSARRIMLYLMEDKEHRMQNLAEALTSASELIKTCSNCFNLDVEDPCYICSSHKRDIKTIAIVESIADLWALERSNSYNGLFHIIESNLNARAGVNPNQLKLEHLHKRANQLGTEEIIIATNSTLDGQTTAFYITEFFKTSNIKISRLASGIPIGGELDYLDEGTVSAALKLRTPF